MEQHDSNKPIVDYYNKLSFESTMNKKMVHRTAIFEVFLTDQIKIDDLHFVVGAQLPRSHSLYCDMTTDRRAYDTMMLLEVFRQASISTSHSFLDVPMDYKFVFISCELKLLEFNGLLEKNESVRAIVDVKITDELLKNEIRAGITLDMTLYIEDVPVAKKIMTIRWMTSERWAQLRYKGLVEASNLPEKSRGIYTGDIVEKSSIGRDNNNNIFLKQINNSEKNIETLLIVDQDNPVIFDHPLDHIPGMLMLEGFRQTSFLAARTYFPSMTNNLVVSDIQVEFEKFGEYTHPTLCKALIDDAVVNDSDGSITITLEMKQANACIARSVIKLSSLSHYLIEQELNDMVA
jgi:hypothetical protein